MPAKYVQPIHFEDFSGTQFERPVFAYHARSERWHSLEWYGQAGSDLGRDIWGIRNNVARESVCIQCVNRERLTFAKAQRDLDKVLSGTKGHPSVFRLVARTAVSARMRDKIRRYVLSKGVVDCDIWSGAEFEEFLRKNAESLLKRFVEGEEFPDAAQSLLKFAKIPRSKSADEAHPPIFGPWYVSQNRLELSGRELAIHGREISRHLRCSSGSKVEVRLRSADKIRAELARIPVDAKLALTTREKRYEWNQQLDALRDKEQHLTLGVSLMLSEPTIADLLVDQPAITTCVANFVNGYMCRRWGIIHPGETKYVINPAKHRTVYGWLALTAGEKAAYNRRLDRLVRRFGNPRIVDSFWELPEEIRFTNGVPCAIDSIVRAVRRNNESLDILRRDESLNLHNWVIRED